MAVQWLHAAQAPVRPRHCTQALLQQPDQLLLSTQTRSASRALLNVRLRRLPRLPPLRASTSRRRASVRRGSLALWPRNVNVRESGKDSPPPVTHMKAGAPMRFAPFASCPDAAFFTELARMKLHEFKLDDRPVPIRATFARARADVRRHPLPTACSPAASTPAASTRVSDCVPARFRWLHRSSSVPTLSRPQLLVAYLLRSVWCPARCAMRTRSMTSRIGTRHS